MLMFASSPPVEIVGRAEVSDGDTLRVAGRTIRLFGVDAPERDQQCRISGRQAACGQMASVWLSRRVQDRTLRCSERDRDRYDRVVATCRVDGRDLGAELVSAGWAVAFRQYSQLYVAEEEAAKRARRGLWAGTFEQPAEHRARGTAERPPQVPPSAGCAIKGNINANGERIFHTPASSGYAETRVSESRGERWFCSPAEALAAGWRAPR
jgi:endonuclease YncB( thermonuclease family)